MQRIVTGYGTDGRFLVRLPTTSFADTNQTLLETVLAHPQILEVPLLLLANKQDAPNSLSVNDVRASYEAWWQTRRPEGEDHSEGAQIGSGMIMGEDQRGASLDVMGVSALEGCVFFS
jgi:ADP-ribosylation factor related protein 1